jgi:4a-hydroxytetrahydrobiopterin dehydratase
MARYAVDDQELADALTDLKGWSVVNGKLHKEFRFDSFAAAIGWIVNVAIEADKMDHHPEWSNVYNRVRVDLVTHDLDDSISNWDIELARVMNSLV